MSLQDKILRHRFNPYFSGSVTGTGSLEAENLLAKMFQSLF